MKTIVDNMRENLETALESEFERKDKSYYVIELELIDTLGLFRTRKFDEAIKLSEVIINDSRASIPQKIRASFYRAISWNRQEYDKCKELHLDVFKEINQYLEKEDLSSDVRTEILKVKAELANNFGFVVMRTEPELALEYFKLAIEIRETPEINDQKGIGIANGGIGDCLSALDDIDGARDAYLKNYDISKRNGDYQGIGRMSSMLGGLILKEIDTLNYDEETKNKKLNEAIKYYSESLSVAYKQKNGISVAFAIAGLLNAEGYSDKPDVDYLIKRIEKFDLAGVPDFAKGAIDSAISKFQEKFPNLKKVTEEIIEKCNLK
jgi:tetratricopeptide (TPR) repeat protein